MIELIDEFKSGLIWQVGNGKTIKFWLDNWVSRSPLSDSINTQVTLNKDATVAEFMLPNKTWNKNLLEQYLPHDLVTKITSIPIPLNDIHDRMYWEAARMVGFLQTLPWN